MMLRTERMTDAALKALMMAVVNGDQEKLQSLLGTDPDLELRDANGMTAILYAAWALNYPALRMLHEAGAKLYARGPARATAVSYAGLEPVRTPFRAGERVKIWHFLRDKKVKDEPTHGASSVRFDKTLIGQPVRCMRNAGDVLVRAAAAYQHRLIGELVRAGADPNARDCWGDTAAHMAAEINSQKMLRKLDRLGADFCLLDRKGRDVAERARVPDSRPDTCLLDRKGREVQRVRVADREKLARWIKQRIRAVPESSRVGGNGTS